MGPEQLQGLLQFIHEAEGAKKLLRHSWLSDGRRESVAEHSWRMNLMAIPFGRALKIDMSRILMMITIHDLGEVHSTDYHAFKDIPPTKYQEELEGLRKITRHLIPEVQTEIIDLWQEFEEGETPEAKLAVALDKMEVLIQHNEAPIGTWDEREYSLNFVYGDKQVAYSDILRDFRQLIKDECQVKIDKEPKSI